MDILLYNNSWMLYNAMLAILAVLLGYFTILAKGNVAKIIVGIFWFAFLPNTIYVYTDLMHLIHQWNRVPVWGLPILVIQHAILQIVGIITFVLAYRPFEIFLASANRFKNYKLHMIIFFNFIITYGIVLGRIERVNSWEIVSNPINVINSAISVFTTPSSLGLLFLLWIVTNCIYFLFRDIVLEMSQHLFRKTRLLMHKYSIDK